MIVTWCLVHDISWFLRITAGADRSTARHHISTIQSSKAILKNITQIYKRLECMANHCDPSYSEKGSAAPKIDQISLHFD